MRDKISKYKEKADDIVQKAVTTVEIGSASFGMGVLMGKTGGFSILGVPLDLGLGLGMNLLGFLGVGGKYADHLHNLGNGSLAHNLGALGYKIGDDWKHGEKPGAKKSLASGTRGEIGRGGSSGAGLSDQQLADLVEASR